MQRPSSFGAGSWERMMGGWNPRSGFAIAAGMFS